MKRIPKNLVRGGQGRSSKEVVDSALSIFWLALLVGLTTILVLTSCSEGRSSPPAIGRFQGVWFGSWQSQATFETGAIDATVFRVEHDPGPAPLLRVNVTVNPGVRSYELHGTGWERDGYFMLFGLELGVGTMTALDVAGIAEDGRIRADYDLLDQTGALIDFGTLAMERRR